MPTEYSAVVMPASWPFRLKALRARSMRCRILIVLPLSVARAHGASRQRTVGSFGSRSSIPSWVHQACAAICGRQRALGRDVYKKAGTDSDQRAEFEISGWHGVLGPEPLCGRGRLAAELRSVRQTRQAGVDLSVRELLGQLAGTEETVFLYRSTGGRPRARRMLPR